MNDITPFQRLVYEAVSLVPRGQVTTYRLVAEHIGCRSCQAVGQALRRNPFAPRVPCHRVIAGDLTIGGFAGARRGASVRHKEELLLAEGVRFEAGHLCEPDRVFGFSREER